MLYIYTAKLKEGKAKQYKAWALKNTEELKRRHGQGWKLVGAYGSMGLSDFDVAWIWQFNRWSDWDTYYDLDDKALERLLEEEDKFLLPGTGRTVVIREMEDWLMPITKKKKR